MSKYKNPTWWTKDHDSAWDKVKSALQRDWDQTKHDMGGKKPETMQNAADTVKQASGNQAIPPRGQPVYEKAESALRFGYGAKHNYGKKYPVWNDDLEKELKRDWSSSNEGETTDWGQDSGYIRKGWDHKA